MAGVIHSLKEKQPKGGTLPNTALHELASRLVYVFLRWRPKKNQDWRTFVSTVLTVAGIKHPDPADPKNGARFDALISDKAREHLAAKLRAKSPGAGRASTSSDTLPLASSRNLGSAILAATNEQRVLEPMRQRRRPRKKGT